MIDRDVVEQDLDQKAAPPDDFVWTSVLQASVPMRRSTVNILGGLPSKNTCSVEESGLVVAGKGRTNASGHWEIMYSGDVLCGIGDFDPDGTLALEPYVVATPQSSRPAVLTVRVTGDMHSGFRIEVTSYGLNGLTLAGVHFAWHAVSLTRFVVG